MAQIIEEVIARGRDRLYEHEVYDLLKVAGGLTPPHYRFLSKGEKLTKDDLAGFPGDRVVLKVVSPDVVHKSDAGGVAFVDKKVGAVHREITRMIETLGRDGAEIEGVLVVQCVETGHRGFGGELFVGIRASREFGAVIAAGLGGMDTEYLALAMKEGRAVARALAVTTSVQDFLDIFKTTTAYDVMAGKARGHRRIVSDDELLRCFDTFIKIARRHCMDSGDGKPGITELEVNPFAFADGRMVPLDGRARLGKLTPKPVPRPIEKVHAMLEPRSIAVMGVSAKAANFGRIILNNVQKCDYPADKIYIIKDHPEPIDGIPCTPSLADVPEKIDLLVLATPAKEIPRIIQQVVEGDYANSAIVIPGGLGEKEGTEDVQVNLKKIIAGAHTTPGGGPVFLGGNSMGVRSRMGSYDTFFIPDKKLDPRHGVPPRRVAIISQSGAFIITRMSNLEALDPKLAMSVGNQVDLTMADLLLAVGRRDELDCIGVYVEGFNDLDGIDFVKAVKEVTATGKTVVFYKAGRTPAGRSATAGHTASLAGDYDVCHAVVTQAGALVADTFKEFEQLLEIATHLHGKRVGGRRIAAMSNAGYETVGMADSIIGARYELEMPPLNESARDHVLKVLARHRLDALVNPRNPLDITPMASDAAYEDLVRALLSIEEIDAVVVSCVPLSPMMLTTPDEIAKGGSLVDRLPKVFGETDKPVVCVIDSGPQYDALAGGIREAGVPVFRSSDQAIRSLGRYLCHRTAKAL
ncbi:MAG: acetate--CoA ligase family protein [Phycisphaerales bacterium]|nr:MAG: acetate--CoA ligase family protein [Phycisphaerales bacterium]